MAAGLLAIETASAQAGTRANLYVGAAVFAAEDLSDTSDEDYNDAVVRYNKRCVEDVATGDRVEEVVHLTPLAAGARRTNALHLVLPATPSSVTVQVGDGPETAVSPDPANEIAVLADLRDGFDGPASGFVNTEAGQAIAAGKAVVVRSTYAAGVLNDPGSCPPPDLVVKSEGDRIDTTTYLGGTSQPLALHLPEGWEVPVERQAIGGAYPRFLSWVASVAGGCTEGETCVDEDWHTSADAARVRPRPALATTAALAPQPDCGDGVANQDETDADCGGAVCGPCVEGQSCLVDGDCDDSLCDDGTAVCRPGLGCETGLRRGFTDEATWPTVALCGDTYDYPTAVAQAPSVCAPGWHMCTAPDVSALSGPTPSLGVSAWVEHTDAETTYYRTWGSLGCTGTGGAWSNLRGTGGCTNSGSHPEGWRLYINWDLSHESGLGCIDHTAHACGFPGGSVGATYRRIACCLD